jgi:hypothetical protein
MDVRSRSGDEVARTLLSTSPGGISMQKKIFITAGVTSMFSISVALADDGNDNTNQPQAACEVPDCPPPPPPPAPPASYMMEQPERPVYVEEKPGMYSYDWYDPTLQSGIGVAFALGGGIGGFTDSSVNNISSSEIGGVWQFRTTIGSHTPLGVDLSYNGTAYDVQNFEGVTSDTLVGTNFEGAVRWNILPHYAWNPYAFIGLGWQHYDLTDDTLTRADSGIGSSDDLLVIPMGIGLAYRDPSGFVGELRGTFRAADNSDFIEDVTGNDADLHTWEASAGVGYEL